MGTSKQDRQSARTAADLERKYGFGRTFAELLGIAEDARTAAEEASEAVENLDQEEIFKRLTNNGEAQGVFRGEDGNIYINAAYIVAISELFAKDIVMSGKFTNTAEVFLEPGQEEADTVKNHVTGVSAIPDEEIPLYDFDGDGQVGPSDYIRIKRAVVGNALLKDWEGAKKSTVTVTINPADPKNVISLQGTNMWGREVNVFISADALLSTFAPRAYVDSLITADEEYLYRIVDGESEWFNPPMAEGEEYRTIERWNEKVVYTKLINLGTTETSKSERVIIDSGISNLVRAVPNLNATLCGNVADVFEFYAERISGSEIRCNYNVDTDHVGQQLYVQIWFTVD